MHLTEERWRRLEQLFVAATELAGDERASFVDRETAGDDELRRHLEGMLTHASAAASNIAQVIDTVAGTVTAENHWLGRRFGPYRIVHEIGRGGMGIVFKAIRDDQEYNKTVALKVAPWWRDTGTFRERFRLERQILAELDHPNIARFLDGGTEEGLPYFVMEYIEGTPITVHCRQANLPLRARVKLFLQVCDAVNCAHERLVIHRDLKPGNILVNSGGVPKLLDFGVAKLLAAVPNDSGTTTGSTLFTPDYACPEQVRGKSVSTRSDVYSLGLVLYEMLCDERAQVVDTSSPLAIDHSVCEAEPPLLSERASRQGNAHQSARLQGDLDTIVGTAIRKEPERRYESVAALREDLRRYLDGKPVLARPGTVAYRSLKFIKRNLIAVTAVFAVVVSLFAGVGVSVMHARRAEARFNQVRKLANTFLFQIHERIRNLPGSTEARSFVLKTAVDYLDSLASEAGNDNALLLELASGYEKVATVQGDGSNAHLGQPKEALISFEKAIQLAARVLNRDPTNPTALRLMVNCHSRKGHVLRGEGEGSLQAGFDSLRKAQDYSARMVAVGLSVVDDHLADLTLHQSYGDIMYDDAPAEALVSYQKAIHRAEEAFAKTGDQRFRSAIPATYLRISRAYRVLGDLDRCVVTMEKAVQIAEQLPSSETPTHRQLYLLASLLEDLGKSHGDSMGFHLNEPGKAVQYLLRARELQTQITTTDPHNQQAVRALTGTSYALAGAYILFDPSLAVRYAQQSIEIAQRTLKHAPENFLDLIILNNGFYTLARAHIAAGDPLRSIPLLQQALGITERTLKRSPSHLAPQENRIWNQTELGRASLALKRWPDAERYLRSAAENVGPLVQRLPKDLFFLRDQAEIIEVMGDLALSRGDREGARARYQQARQLWVNWARLAVPSAFTKLHFDTLDNKLRN